MKSTASNPQGNRLVALPFRLLAMVALGLQTLILHSQQPPFSTNGLIAYYTFNGNVNDGTGITGPLIPTSNQLGSYVADRSGSSQQAYFDGPLDNDGLIKTSFSWPNPNSTISIWYRIPNIHTFKGGRIFEHGWDINNQNGLITAGIWTNGAPRLEVCIKDTGCMSFGYILNEDWHNLIVVIQNRTATMYSDGVIRSSLVNVPTNVYTKTLYIGGRAWGGEIDDVRIFNRALSPNEVHSLYISENTFPPSQAKGEAVLYSNGVRAVNIVHTGHGYEGVIPPVHIIGGGGSGATATAVVTNGMVVGLKIISTGSGYTNAPYVLIAAPPGLASVDIAVHSVDVTLHLIPGYTYTLQTSTDGGNNWVDVENKILAIDSTIIKTFDVTAKSQLFRVVQTD